MPSHRRRVLLPWYRTPSPDDPFLLHSANPQRIFIRKPVVSTFSSGKSQHPLRISSPETCCLLRVLHQMSTTRKPAASTLGYQVHQKPDMGMHFKTLSRVTRPPKPPSTRKVFCGTVLKQLGTLPKMACRSHQSVYGPPTWTSRVPKMA